MDSRVNRVLVTAMNVFHNRKKLTLLFGLTALVAVTPPVTAAPPHPNFIVIYCDNLGNGDVACFGSKLHRTPNLDRMAAEGMKLTSFYVTSGVCTPSRASLMTGCYPRRVNMHVSGSGLSVLRPMDTKGLNPSEETIAEVLKKSGYATACIGKWHLGDQPCFLPTRQGFDEFFGLPYSDDMTKDKFPDTWPELPLMRGEEVIEAPADRDQLTKRCTEEAVSFITRHKTQSFFLYFPQPMPGSTPDPFSSAAFKGKSRNGHYGDSIEEIDWSMGEILKTLKECALEENTLILWTSDNGAVQRTPPQGSNAPYKGFGYNTSEGAMRMPCILRWPGHVPAGAVCDELCTNMDALPTFAKLAGASLPDVPIDGHDASALWFSAKPGHSAYDDTGFFFYHMQQLQAVRAGDWKLYLPLQNKLGVGKQKAAPIVTQLFDVRHDVGEEHEASAQHPEIAQRLSTLAEQARQELGDMNQPGSGQRPAGRVDHPVPQLLKAK
jgi:arylsulfatase A-like enzyme